MKDVLPFYNAIQEGLEEITHYNKLSWNNIVSRENEVPLNKSEKKLVAESEEFKKLSTTLQKASINNRAFTEQKMKGGKKNKKTKKVKRKRKTYKRKHRNKKRDTKSRKKGTKRKRRRSKRTRKK